MRQFLYKSGSVCVDMLIRPRLGSMSAVLMGQLLDSRRPTHFMKNVPIQLLRDGVTIGEKRTTAEGEFDFGIDAVHDLRLVIGIGKRKVVVGPLPD